MASVMQGAGRGGRGAIVGINVTPMVDVVLVLLVIMMVSATYIVSQSMHVDLPKTASSDGSDASPAAVTLARTGALFFNGERVSEPQLIERLRRAYAGNREVSLVLSADSQATHGAVVHVMDLAKTVGITKFAINVEARE
jgi:biopolymer transport protein ExbD